MKTKQFKCPNCGWTDDKNIPLTKNDVRDVFIGLKKGISVAEMAQLIGRTKQFVYAIKNRKFRKKWTEDLE